MKCGGVQTHQQQHFIRIVNQISVDVRANPGMAIPDRPRLTNEQFQLDIDGLRRGVYSDQYFVNVARILGALSAEGYGFDGHSPRDLRTAVAGTPVGDLVVEAQIFNRRAPRALVVGVDMALAMLRYATGYPDAEGFVETWVDLDVVAVPDGTMTHYAGRPNEVETVIEIRGRYRDFTLLETTVLGALTRGSRIATNVYDVLEVSNGKPVLFFPARFDLPSVQSFDGYAYWLAVQRYNLDTGHSLTPLASTDAQASWWGGRGGGTIPHALIACFFADTATTMRAYARHIPVDVPRIALVDFNNDTVRDSLAVLDTYWPHYREALATGDTIEQRRWTLHGVRLDTSGNMLDKSLREGDGKGVSPALVHTVREALNNAWQRWNVSEIEREAAQNYCRGVQIVASGGFNRERIESYERQGVPVDSYGVGSTFLANGGATSTDYTMDVVRVKVGDTWLTMPKEGRQPGDHPDLTPIDLSVY